MSTPFVLVDKVQTNAEEEPTEDHLTNDEIFCKNKIFCKKV